MLRTLPPAGHPLRLREIISVIQRNEENGNFLEELFPDIPNYLVSSGSAALTPILSHHFQWWTRKGFTDPGRKQRSHGKYEIRISKYPSPDLNHKESLHLDRHYPLGRWKAI